MKFEKIHNKGQAQLFRNQYLEYLTKTHPLVIWGMYLPVIIFMLYYSSITVQLKERTIVLAFLSGIFFWSLFEYMMHRFAFHFFAESEQAKKIIYIIHGNHHEYPRDRERLFMPPVPNLVVAVIIFSSLYFAGGLFGIRNYVFAFFPGFVLGYLTYGSMHYIIHAYNPPFKNSDDAPKTVSEPNQVANSADELKSMGRLRPASMKSLEVFTLRDAQ